MAKDDYFDIVCRILKYLYECFKKGDRADIEIISAEALNINDKYWNNIIKNLYTENYITNVYFYNFSNPLFDVEVRRKEMTNIKITHKGIMFLTQRGRRLRCL